MAVTSPRRQRLLSGAPAVILEFEGWERRPGMTEAAMKWRLDPGQIEVMDEAVAEVLRGKTPADRVAMVCDAHRTARLVIAAGVRHLRPEWDEPQVEAEVARRLLGGTD